MTISLVSGGVPCQSTCSPWATIADLCPPCDSGDYDEQTMAGHLQVASDILFHLSGRQFAGSCQDVARPCARSLVMDHGRPFHGGFGGAGYYPGPWLGGDYSQYGFCSCNRTERSGCSSVPEITLGVYPLTGIVEVKIDGAVVDPTTYRIDDNRWLVRTTDSNGQPLGWPCCQDAQKDSSQPGTWEVTFTYGTPAPPGGVRACAELACQLALACDPSKAGSCSLPQRVTQVTRQGMTAIVLDPFAFLDKGKTGLFGVDLWLESINPTGLRRRSIVSSPDISKRVRRAGF